jgi:DNA-binding SARP family transcriptional activator
VHRVKVEVPRVRALPRARLDELVATLHEHRAALVLAPAGSGKTTLLAQLAGSWRGDVAWYRMEQADWSEAAAVAHLERALTGGLDGLSGGWSTVDDALTALDDWAGGNALLVIDDLHAVAGTPAEAAFAQLCEYAPPSLTLLAASRRPPAFDLSRLRVSGAILEVPADALRFRSWEVEQLFRDHYRAPLTPEEAALLTRRTGGWAAGLQLFHLATRDKSPARRRAVLDQLRSGSRLVREYLARNVIEELPAELREFLVETCVLGTITGDLSDRLIGRTGSAEVLSELEHLQVFTSAVDDRGTYRYHEALRAHLEGLLVERVGETEAAGRWRRAADLLEEQGASTDALVARCRAGDWDGAKSLLGRVGASLLLDVGGGVELTDRLPPGLVEEDPWLMLATARNHLAAGRLATAVDYYRRAEAAGRDTTILERCRRERQELSGWVEALSVPATDWMRAIRAALRRNPMDAMRQAALVRTPAGRLAEGIAAWVAGWTGRATDLFAAAASSPDASPVLATAARVLWVLAGLDGGLDMTAEAVWAVEDAERLGVGLLVTAARIAWAEARGAGDELEELKVAATRRDERWTAALAAYRLGVSGLWTSPDAFRVLDEAAEHLRGLDAPVPAAWATSLAALARAAAVPGPAHGSADPSAETEGGHAATMARSLGAPGARAAGLLAVALARPDRAAEVLAQSAGLGFDSGDLTARLAAEVRDRLAPASGPAGDRAPSEAQRPVEGDGGAGRAAGSCVRCFGRFEIEVAGRPVDLGAVKPKARAALRLLALNAGRPVHRELLAEALWPDADARSSIRNLQVAISSLRQALDAGETATPPDAAAAGGETGTIVRDGDGYALRLPEPVDADVAEFDRALARARFAAEPAERAAALEAALDTYRGALLPEDGPADWVVDERERRRGEVAGCAAALARIRLESGDHHGVVEACRRGLVADPYADSLWRLLLDAHRRAGDRAAEARAQHDYELRLAELGIVGASPSSGIV